jgi:hypothetical protein
MIGFETTGNATLIAHDGPPVLCTDPWIEGEAYFGSWTHRYGIPDEQRAAILACDHVWFSHGHPDHLNAGSLPYFKGRKILLPDHVGRRIENDLRAQGHDVHVLETNKWYRLSDHIKVLCLTDYNQDAVLLVDINGRLLLDLNDSSNRDWTAYIRRLTAQYPQSFALRLINHGDADMMNYVDEDGRRIVPPRIKSVPLGAKVMATLNAFGARHYVPFSTFHLYQRTDSAWANDYVVMDASELRDGFDEAPERILPDNLRYDCETDRFERIDAPALPVALQPPEAFGDDWSETLDRQDVERATAYFRGIESLAGNLDFVRLVVGGRETVIDLSHRNLRVGVTFEAPRHSLMKAIEWEIFDDLLIGNYMKTTVHGMKSLYPYFTPYVAKYADNGRARTRAELRAYWQEYRRRNPLAMMKHELGLKTTQKLRNAVLSNDRMIKLAYAVYRQAAALQAKPGPRA